jgi:triacylglycerol lipase
MDGSVTFRSTRHLVDPQLADLLDVMPTIKLTAENLGFHRIRTSVPLAGGEGRDDVGLEIRTVPGPTDAPEVGIRIYRPTATTGALPCIFHIHGGGYVLGSTARQEPQHRAIAAEIGCVFLTVDYRLAPEARFPGPLNDCHAALTWLFANAGDLGIDTARVGVMGESAGGGLAAALALLVRDRGGPPLAFQQLIYPMIDDRTCVRPDPHPHTGEFVWTRQNNRFGWTALLGVEPGSDGVSPYAAAARAEDLAGLPPTFIAAGALDLFLEEDMDYARRLLRHGVPTEFHVYPGCFHGFLHAPNADVAVAARRDGLAALARFCADGSASSSAGTVVR